MCAVFVKELEDKKIVDISCGQQHTVALDPQGSAFVRLTDIN
jgi:alpha-tubulin suppressor-like RCC1 family protein